MIMQSTSWNVVYLSPHWSEIYNAGQPVPESAWRLTGSGYSSQVDAFIDASRWGTASKQVYAVIETVQRRVIVIDPARLTGPDFSDRG